jgi:hypothetical protein
MCVVIEAADRQGLAFQTANGATDIRVEILSPDIGDDRLAVLGCEDKVDVQTEVGGGHGRFWHPFRVRALRTRGRSATTGLSSVTSSRSFEAQKERYYFFATKE